MRSANLSPVAGYAVSRRRAALRLSERGKLVLGTALVLFELVAVLSLFDWQDRKDADLARHGVDIEAMIGGRE